MTFVTPVVEHWLEREILNGSTPWRMLSIRLHYVNNLSTSTNIPLPTNQKKGGHMPPCPPPPPPPPRFIRQCLILDQTINRGIIGNRIWIVHMRVLIGRKNWNEIFYFIHFATKKTPIVLFTVLTQILKFDGINACSSHLLTFNRSSPNTVVYFWYFNLERMHDTTK